MDCQALRDTLLSVKLSATHAHWRDGVLAHNIVNVCHIPGKINIADGVSRQYKGTDKTPGDGSEWTVTPDWEEITGLVRDLYLVAETPDLTVLKERFKDEPLFLDVVDAIIGLSSGDTTAWEKKRAQHRKPSIFSRMGNCGLLGVAVAHERGQGVNVCRERRLLSWRSLNMSKGAIGTGMR